MKKLILLMLFLAAFTLNAQDTLFVSSNTIELSKAGKRIYKGANVLYVKKNLPSNIQFGNASSFYELIAPAGQLNVSINGAPAVSGMSYDAIYAAIKENITSLTSSSGGGGGISSSVSVTNFPAVQAVSGSFWPATQPVSGSVTATISNPYTVSASDSTKYRSSINVLNFPATQAVSGTVSATQSGTWNIGAIASALPAGTNSIGRVVSSAPTSTSGVITSVVTNATGSLFTAFASQACTQLYLANNTGTAIEFQLGGSGTAMPVFNGAYYLITGIANASSVGIRRVDQSNTTVTVQAHALTN